MEKVRYFYFGGQLISLAETLGAWSKGDTQTVDLSFSDQVLLFFSRSRNQATNCPGGTIALGLGKRTRW